MHLRDISQPPRGAHVQLADLIALRFPARQLRITRKSRALSVLAGPNKSNFRGRGIDFEEVRRYQPGDDIRTIDWRVTARTDNAHTKIFQEERERPVLVVIDQRNSMFFGSSHCFKSVLAAQLASLFAWSALDNGERVGGLVFNDAGHREIRPRRSRKNVLALLSQVDSYNQLLPLDPIEQGPDFADMLANLRRIARPGSSLFIVSDFRGAANGHAQEHLYQLAQHTEITAVSCSDPLEQELPRAGRYAVTDGQERSELATTDRRLRQAYQNSWEEREQALASHLQKLGIPLIRASTDQAPFGVLQTYYGESRR
jgi:uncharacterized protein (DUF58 family)